MTEIILQKSVAAAATIAAGRCSDDSCTSRTSVPPAAGGYKIDLVVHDLPQNFLGLAFDLKFNDPAGAADFAEVLPGQIIGSLPVEEQPIIMAKALPEQSKLVFGLTWKAKNLPKLSDGVLATFTFKNGDPGLMELENQVASIYDQGRHDWRQTSWKIDGGNIASQTGATGAKTEKPANLQVSAPNLSPAGEEQKPTVTVPNNLNDQALLEILNAPAGVFPAVAVSWYWLAPLLILMLVLALVGAVFFRKKKMKVTAPGLGSSEKAGLA